MALAVQVTMDAADPGALARFWTVALGYRMAQPPDDRWARLADPDGRGPTLFFQRVPSADLARRNGKNWVHLDVHAGVAAISHENRVRMIRAHAAVLVAAGARLVEERDEDDQFWIVMHDPEGNVFCVD
jgi:Glyoxalase-like domain